MKVAVLTDSTAYIPLELREKYNIHMVPLSVTFEDASYREEIDITTEEFYEKMRKSEELPKTSQPSVGVILEKIKELSTEYDAVISIHLSSEISGTYQAVTQVGDMIEGIKVYPFDSELSAMPQGFYVLEAAKMALEHKQPEEILLKLNEMQDKIRAYFMVEDLTNLRRGGRLSNAQAVLGSLLSIKPVLHFVDKVIVPFEKIRTRKKAISRIMEMLEEDARQNDLARVVFIHGNDKEAAETLRAEFSQKYPEVETLLSYFGPVIGTHLGEGAMGVSWYKK